jgi:hypothetical protein
MRALLFALDHFKLLVEHDDTLVQTVALGDVIK